MTTEHIIEDCRFVRGGTGSLRCSCGQTFVRPAAGFPSDDAKYLSLEKAWIGHSGNGTLEDWLAKDASDEAEAERVTRRLWVDCAGCGKRFHGQGVLCSACRGTSTTPDDESDEDDELP